MFRDLLLQAIGECASLVGRDLDRDAADSARRRAALQRW
jgi:hypothetical protein